MTLRRDVVMCCGDCWRGVGADVGIVVCDGMLAVVESVRSVWVRQCLGSMGEIVNGCIATASSVRSSEAVSATMLWVSGVSQFIGS